MRGRGRGLEAGLLQEAAAAQSSADLGEAGAARCWDGEQAYLAGLVERYRPEQYPDSYEAMSEWAGPEGGSLASMSPWGVPVG